MNGFLGLTVSTCMHSHAALGQVSVTKVPKLCITSIGLFKPSARQVVVASEVVSTCSGSLISPRHVLTAVRLHKSPYIANHVMFDDNPGAVLH